MQWIAGIQAREGDAKRLSPTAKFCKTIFAPSENPNVSREMRNRAKPNLLDFLDLKSSFKGCTVTTAITRNVMRKLLILQ